MIGEEVSKISLMETKFFAGYPFIIIHQDFATNFDFPALAELTGGNKTQTVWVFRNEFADINESQKRTIWPKDVRINQVYASNRVFKFFDHECQEMELTFPVCKKLLQRAARVDQLPESLSVEVSSDVFKSFAKPGRRVAWAVATRDSFAIPVRLIRSSETNDADFKCNAIFKNFLSSESKDTIQFSHPSLIMVGKETKAIRKLPLKNYFYKHDKASRIAATFISGTRSMVDILEFLLKSYFKAPKLIFLTLPADLGDDNQSIVRLHPGAFTMIGISPGDEVIVEWCGRRTSAIAYERLYQGSKFEKSNSITDHLNLSVSSQVRFDLGIHKYTAVEVRRKVIPKLLDNLNSVFIPVISVVAGGLSIKMSGVTVFVLACFAALLSLGKVRHPTAKPGELPTW